MNRIWLETDPDTAFSLEGATLDEAKEKALDWLLREVEINDLGLVCFSYIETDAESGNNEFYLAALMQMDTTGLWELDELPDVEGEVRAFVDLEPAARLFLDWLGRLVNTELPEAEWPA